MEKMTAARSKNMLEHPFFGLQLLRTEVVMVPGLGTAATDGTKHYYDPAFVEMLPIAKLQGLQVHELCHDILEHGLRRNGRDPELWNMAADYEINIRLKDTGFELPDGGLISSRYRDWSAEQIYDDLEQNGHPDTACEAKAQEGQGGMSGDLRAPPMTPEQSAEASRQLRRKVQQAVVHARAMGKMPGGFEQLIGDITRSKASWEELLRDYMMRTVRSEETWARRNRRIRTAYLPSLGGVRMGEIINIGDTSGSFSAGDYAKAAGSIMACVDQCEPERVRIVWGDVRVQSEQVFEHGEKITFKPKGGGGTDMRVLLRHVEQYDPAIVVLYTDGATPWPSHVPYPLIVCCTTDLPVPIGEVVRV